MNFIINYIKKPKMTIMILIFCYC